MRLDLADDPAVISMADFLGVQEHAVVGYLHAIWSWASRNSNDGSVTGVTLAALGRVTRCQGVPEAMASVGWLVLVEDGDQVKLYFPNWDRWNSQSAKQRVLASRRVSRHRKRNSNDCGVTESLPQKRTEENKKPPPPTPSVHGRGGGAEAEEGDDPKWRGVPEVEAEGEEPKRRGEAEAEGDLRALAEELKAIGLADTPGAVAAVRSRGESESSALAAVAQYQASRPTWGPGALYWRLTRGTWPEAKGQVRQSLAGQTRDEYITPIRQAKQADQAEGLGNWQQSLQEMGTQQEGD